MSENTFEKLTSNIYKDYDKLTTNNRINLDSEDILSIEDLIVFAKKYPQALILSQQIKASEFEDSEVIVDIAVYPDFHFRKVSKITKITANEKIIVLSNNHENPILEAFDTDKLKKYNDYLTGAKFLKIIGDLGKRYYFNLRDHLLLNNHIEEFYFIKNNWENMYYCDETKYTCIFHGGKSDTLRDVFIMDSHY